jgi:hypothetical protein
MAKEVKITEKNIFEKGILIQLNMRTYEGMKRMREDQLEQLPTEIVRGVHDLFLPDFKDTLRAMKNYGSQTHNVLSRLSIPFFIDGVYFVPFSKVANVVEILGERIETRKKMVETAAEDYEEAIARFAEKYPDYYAKAAGRYPSKAEFKRRFYLSYRLFQINTPNAESGLISSDVYKQEMRKFKESIQEVKDDLIATIYTELVEKTKTLLSQCDKGKPNQRTLENLNKFFVQMDEVYSDFVDRKDIKDIAKKIKAQVLGIDADSLKGESQAKEEFKKALSEATEQLKALPDIKLKRAIDF